MTLIAVIISLALDRLSIDMGGLRSYAWYQRLLEWLDERLRERSFWNGTVGLLIAVGIPVSLVMLLSSWLDGAAFLYLLFSVFILLYCLGPGNLWDTIDRYINAMRMGDREVALEMASDLVSEQVPGNEDPPGTLLLESILLEANRRVFAVLLWFIVLGPTGAVLARVTLELRHNGRAYAPNTNSEFRESVRDLEAVVNFVPARVVAFGYALSGSLLHAFEDWKAKQIWGLYGNDRLLKEAGLGALLLGSTEPADSTTAERLARVEAARSLIWRTLCILVGVLALMTVAGWAG